MLIYGRVYLKDKSIQVNALWLLFPRRIVEIDDVCYINLQIIRILKSRLGINEKDIKMIIFHVMKERP
jgi:hypothetical protein